VDFAFQWNIPALQPGQTSRVIVSLSDNGQHNSGSFLSASHSAEEVLVFSGTAQVVPEPTINVLLCAGISGLLIALSRRRKHGIPAR